MLAWLEINELGLEDSFLFGWWRVLGEEVGLSEGEEMPHLLLKETVKVDVRNSLIVSTLTVGAFLTSLHLLPDFATFESE